MVAAVLVWGPKRASTAERGKKRAHAYIHIYTHTHTHTIHRAPPPLPHTHTHTHTEHSVGFVTYFHGIYRCSFLGRKRQVKGREGREEANLMVPHR